MFSTVLMCHTGTLFYREIFFGLFSQNINSRTMKIFILRHSRSTYSRLISQVILIEHMAGKFYSLLLTPFIERFHICFGKQFCYCPPVIMPEFFTAFSIIKQIGKQWNRTIPSFPLKICRQSVTECNPWTSFCKNRIKIAYVRFIRKKTFHRFTKLMSESFPISLMCQTNKSSNSLRIQIISRSKTIIPFTDI